MKLVSTTKTFEQSSRRQCTSRTEVAGSSPHSARAHLMVADQIDHRVLGVQDQLVRLSRSGHLLHTPLRESTPSIPSLAERDDVLVSGDRRGGGGFEAPSPLPHH